MSLAATLVIAAFAAVAAKEMCHEEGTCAVISMTEAVHASAMLQVSSAPAKVAHLQELKTCLPKGLQEMHRCSMFVIKGDTCGQSGLDCKFAPYAELQLAEKSLAEGTCADKGYTVKGQTSTKSYPVVGDTVITEYTKPASFIEAWTAHNEAAGTTHNGAVAPLDDAGFKAVTSMCCPVEMETFFNRLLASTLVDGVERVVCSKPHVQGLMHWFSCAPDMDFEYVLGIIKNGNPCKYWAPTGTVCPTLTPQCKGEWCR